MPVIEYCTFLAALCLNCGAMGPAAPEVTAHMAGWELGARNTQGGTFPPCSALFWMEACRLWAFCSAFLGRGIWISTFPRQAHTFSLLLCRAHLSQHEHSCSSKHSWLQDSFGTWKVPAFVWTHYAACILPALLLNWDDTCTFCCFSFVALAFRIVFLIVSWGCLRSLK